MTDFGLQSCVPYSHCQLTALASIPDGFWAPDLTGVRLQGVRKQFQIFLEVLKTEKPYLRYSSPQRLYTLQEKAHVDYGRRAVLLDVAWNGLSARIQIKRFLSFLN